jgi:glycosyltransferase involved in cell wall biosynthesis
MKISEFCVVIPVYNEESSIIDFISKLYNYLNSIFPLSFVISIINDNSTDGTLAKILDFKNSIEVTENTNICEIFITSSNRPRGYGNAVKEAFEVNYNKPIDFYIIMDSDGTNPIGDIYKIYEKIQLGFRYIKANRYFSESNFGKSYGSFQRSILSKIAHWIIKRIVKSDCLDPTNGFRAIGAEFKSIVLQSSSGFSSIVEEWVGVEEMGVKISNFNSELGSRGTNQRKSSFNYSISTLNQYLKPVLFLIVRRLRSRFGT